MKAFWNVKVRIEKESVWAKFAHTAGDGKTYQVDYYNLDVIISPIYKAALFLILTFSLQMNFLRVADIEHIHSR